MGFFKKQHLEVIEMAEEGAKPLTIANLLDIPLEEVYEVLEEHYAEYQD